MLTILLPIYLSVANVRVILCVCFPAILDKTVAFHAWNSANPVLATPHGTLVLNHAATNIGNAYNTLTGVFTAPVSGLYDFQTSIMSYYLGAGQYAHCAIYVDNDVVGTTISDSQHGSYSQSTIRAIVHVHAGQKVYLKNTDNTARAYFDTATDPYTAFSGFLVKAD